MLDKELNLRRELEEQSSGQLRLLLQAETEKETPDDDLVLTILHILEDREPDDLTPASAREEAAWKLYQKRIQSRKQTPFRLRRGLANAAVILLVIGLLFSVVPQQAEADSFWEMLVRWTKNAIEMVVPTDKIPDKNMEFHTDHSGLQQVYDAATEMGIEKPLVPMWFPEEYTLVTIENQSTPRTKNLYVLLEFENNEAIFQISISDVDELHGYFGEDTYYMQFEREGAKFKTMRNNDRWTAVWTIETTEYFLTMDCQEDTLQRILDSIYVMEE